MESVRLNGIVAAHAVDFFLTGFLAAVFLAAFFAGRAGTRFIGEPQQMISHSSQSQTSSTTTTIPHSLHSYFSPFFFLGI